MGHWDFVGRSGDLARLKAVTAATAALDATRGMVVSGRPGVGKSRLLREAVHTLPEGRYAVHLAAANATSAGLPFGGLAQVLPAEPPAGLSAAGLLRWAVDALQVDAGELPLLLAVDDAHLLDPPSAALVHLLVREGATLLATVRTGEPVPPPLAALWTEGLVGHAELQPLTVAESRDLLAGMLGAPVEAASALRLARLSGGNPLLLRELVMAARDGGEMTGAYGVWRWTGRLHLAPSLADLVDARVGGLPRGVREVLELVAFGEPLGLDLLRAAAKPGDVEEAEERGLIRVAGDGRRRNVCLGHPLYGEVVRRHCPQTRAHRLLAQLADLVGGTGGRRRDDLLRVAMWRLGSGTAQHPGMLMDAARQAFGRFDLDLAQRLSEAAAGAGAGYEASELLAIALLYADDPDEAAAVLDRVTDAPPARLHTARAVVAFWGLGAAPAADELAAHRTGDAADRARMRAVEAVMRLQLHQIDAARELAAGVLDDPAATSPAPETARVVQSYLAAAGGDPEGSARLLTEAGLGATTAYHPDPALQFALPMAIGTRVGVAFDLPGLDEVLAAEFADLAQTGGFGFGSSWASLLQAQAAWLRGQTGRALELTEQACAALAANRLYDGTAHAARAQAAALRGETDVAVESLAVADRAGDCDTLFAPWRLHARAWTAASSGDLVSAVRITLDLIERMRADGFAGHELLGLHDLVRFGRPELAAGRMQALLLTVPGGRIAAALARHARAAADLSGDGLLAVAREFHGQGHLMFAAEAAASAVRLFRAARDPQALAASTLLADVLHRCDTIRTPALLTVQPSLTNRERQVAELAAVGAKSREIADQLFLSTRTVENHLQRVYAKLGVNGRDALAPALRSLPN